MLLYVRKARTHIFIHESIYYTQVAKHNTFAYFYSFSVLVCLPACIVLWLSWVSKKQSTIFDSLVWSDCNYIRAFSPCNVIESTKQRQSYPSLLVEKYKQRSACKYYLSVFTIEMPLTKVRQPLSQLITRRLFFVRT